MTESLIHITIPEEVILSKIYFIRGQKVMLDRDLAELYGVETKYLKRQVKRNIIRFPEDFTFELSESEFNERRSQIVTSNEDRMGLRYAPFAFTEEGVSQLSTVLNSERAIKVNLQIIRLFSKMRKMLLTHKEILLKLEQLEKKLTNHDEEIEMIFNTLKELIKPQNKERNKIGYKLPEKE
ncbi:MAG: ORF6N domain-containing protein [Bacteroidales bacterium]|nr:ORF6N domain-containing protein [Bacteroidales bacterium]